MLKEKISVILPCFNEEKNIKNNIQIIDSYLKENFSSYEIIISNDGSTDNTANKIAEIKKEIPLKIVETKVNTGKGSAVKNGILASRPDSEIVMFLDADLAIPINELKKFVATLKNQKFDIVIASRFVPGLKVLEPVLWYRKIMEIVFRFLRALILNDWQVKDSQCGFKVFKRDAAIKIFSLTTVGRFAFDSEVIYLAKKFNFKIKELPITLCNSRESHIRMVFDPINMFFALFKIRLNDFKKIYRYQPAELWKDTLISADDFGANLKANNRIIKLIKAHKIDRVAIMIKRNISKEEIKFLKKSGVKLDLHLELFVGEKLKIKKSTLQRGFSFYFQYLKGNFYYSKVKKIWSEQIQEFEKIFGKMPDGLNSHEHFHLFPPFFKIICSLAKKNNIRYIRLGKMGSPYVGKLIRHILEYFFWKNKKTFRNNSRLDSSNYLLSLDWIMKNKNPHKFLKSKTELVCHPERINEYKFIKKLTRN